ncbi:MAG TPA: PTS sugar transporter subunit IIA [bacterium]|nr:PTS sugar transporter subunit IIA [bacterium]
MKLSGILSPERINLDLKATTKEGVLRELVKLLKLSSAAQKNLLATLTSREELGSTGVGNGIAIPHCRSLVVSELVVAIARSKTGINFQSMDGKRAYLFFLIVAPPIGDPSQYLIALGKVAQVASQISKDKRMKDIKQRKQLMDLVAELEA